MNTFGINNLPDMTDAYKLVQEKAKKDYDGDGKIESGSKEHAGAVHNAIQKKKGLKPDGKDTRKEEVEVEEGSVYGLTKGTGKPGGAMKAYLDNRAKKLEAEKKKQKPEYKNNPAFGDPSHHSNKKMKEHHEKDADGKVIEHEVEDTAPASVEEGMKTARKNVGADTCWDGYKAKGTKKKGGKEVPNCVKEEELTEISADLALKASKGAEVARGKAAVAGDKEKAIAKMKQSARLYAKQAAKRRMEKAS